LKIKPLTKEQIVLSIDRLTRFKNTEIKYLRVFRELILHNLLSPNFNKHDLDKMSYIDIKNYAQEVFNYSIELLCGKISHNLVLNERLSEYENSVFKINKETQILLNNEIDYNSCLDFIDERVKNLCWLKKLAENTDIKSERYNCGFYFPIELVVLAEGATEQTLLPEFAKLCDYDFAQNGIFIIPAGGKNQVVKIYYELSESLKIPIFVLFDKDGILNAKEIESRLRIIDKIHIIQCGEFEDALSENLINKALACGLENISETKIDIKEEKGHRVKYLEEIFKHRGMHEFKKVEFAQLVKENINSKADLTPEIIAIIEEIKKMKSHC